MKCARSMILPPPAMLGAPPRGCYARFVLLVPPKRSTSSARAAGPGRCQRGVAPTPGDAFRDLQRDHHENEQAGEQLEEETRDVVALGARPQGARARARTRGPGGG